MPSTDFKFRCTDKALGRAVRCPFNTPHLIVGHGANGRERMLNDVCTLESWLYPWCDQDLCTEGCRMDHLLILLFQAVQWEDD